MMWLLVVGLGLVQADTGIPDPIVVVEKATSSAKEWQIERVTGCYGDLEEARGNVQARSITGAIETSADSHGGTAALTS